MGRQQTQHAYVAKTNYESSHCPSLNVFPFHVSFRLWTPRCHARYLQYTKIHCTVLYCTALYTLCSSLFRESIRRFSSPCLMSSRLPFLSHSLMIPFLPFTNTSTAEEVHILCQRTCCNTNSYLLPSSLFIVFIGSLFSSRFSETLLQYSLTCASCRNKRS